MEIDWAGIAVAPPYLFTGLAVYMVLAGKLIPRRQVDELLEELERWYEAYTAEQEARSILENYLIEEPTDEDR